MSAGSRVVLVTGASSGIGRAVARLAATQGDQLVLVARREDVLEEETDRCHELGSPRTVPVACDVADDADVADLVAHAVEVFGRLDVVVHCAGIVSYGRSEQASAEDFDAVVTTNLLGAANLARHVVPQLREQGEGTLVLVGSLLGHLAVPDMTPYVVSKWGVRALARQLQIENQDVPGLRVVHVAPGSVDTDIYDNALDSAGMINRPPPPTMSPDRVAEVVLARARGGRRTAQTAWSNYAMILAFQAAPALWDRAVGPAFRLLSRRPQDDQG